MALNKLKSFRWINGTSATDYVSLNKDEFDALIELVKRGGITKDIQGYIHPINSITSYQQYLLQLNCPNLVLVDPIVESVDYNVTLDSVEMYEGTRNKINIYLIDLAALDIRIISHTIVRDNAITDEQIRNRISIDSQNGYIVVDSARENSTWTDNVRIEILPKYEDWESELYTPKVLNVLVKANKVTGAQIQTPEVVKPGSFFYPKVVLMPADNSKQLSADPTKGIYLVPFGENFQMTIVNNTITAYAPNNEGTYQLGCRVYAFGLDRLLTDPSDNIQVLNPYIQFIVTTDGTFSDISTANPKITLQKVDSEDTPIGEPIVLTGTVSGSSLVYTYGGGNVAGDGSEYFEATFGNVRGYVIPIIQTIHPTNVITEISAIYTVKQSGIGIVYTDGTEETYDSIINRGSLISNKTPIGIRIESSLCNFVIPLTPIIDYVASLYEPIPSSDRGRMLVNAWDMDITILPHSVTMYNFNTEFASFEADSDVIVPFNSYILTNSSRSANSKKYDPFFLVNSQPSLVVNGESYRGYLPHPLQIAAITSNLSEINVLLTLSNNTGYTDNSVFFTYYATDMNGDRRMTFTKGKRASDGPTIDAGNKTRFSADFLQEHSLENVDYRTWQTYKASIEPVQAYLLPIYLID